MGAEVTFCYFGVRLLPSVCPLMSFQASELGKTISNLGAEVSSCWFGRRWFLQVLQKTVFILRETRMKFPDDKTALLRFNPNHIPQ